MRTAVVLRGTADIRRDLGQGDSERAEWLALLHALEIAAAAGDRDIILVGDSLPVIRQASGKASCPPQWRALLGEALPSFDRVRFRHLKRQQNLAGIMLEKQRWDEF